ncbi:outer membrane beta-barrel protein [Pseudomonas syringae]|uniref:outer membrane beta-barrel protein n=1 Tax=Pseudomonas syringae TaxID=317 RepID=UPI001F8CA5AC|nr:outer membrane beta-barrel protein [Pseudomonas syringae]
MFFGLTTLPALADAPPEGSAFRDIFGDYLERTNNIRVSGLLDVAYSRNNRSTQDERHGGLTNLPVVGVADEGLQLSNLHLFIEKPLAGTMILRGTPLPGPTPQEFSYGINVELAYGRNAEPARTYGWDMHWGVNSPGDDDPEKAKKNKQLFLAAPNFALQGYIPYGNGINIMAGIFGAGLGYEIPPNVRASRNMFASKTYAFSTETGTVSGILIGNRLINNENVLLGAELGVVRGSNNLRDNNNTPSFMGALRLRSRDMQSWIDYEFLVGNSQNESAADIQAPKARLISSENQLKQQYSLNGGHRFNENWSMGAELLYGHQAGDGKKTTIDLIGGPGFEGAHWWGANTVVTYNKTKDLSFSLRAEYFDDPDGFALLRRPKAQGSYHAVTAGLNYALTKNIALRPELRYDWFTPRDEASPFGNGRDRTQLTSTVEMLVYF